MIDEKSLRSECVVDAIANCVTKFVFGHAAMQRKRSDKHDVVDARSGCEFKHGLDDALTNVRALHWGEWQRDVVERDRELHARLKQGGKRFTVADWIHERVANGPVGILECFDGLGRIDHAAASRGKLLETETLSVVEENWRRRTIDVEDESWSRHDFVPFHCEGQRRYELHRGRQRWQRG